MPAEPTPAAGDPGPAAMDVGILGVYQLKRVWWRALAAQRGALVAIPAQERQRDHLVINAIGLGLEQAMQYLRQAPSFEEFERWILDTTGGVTSMQIARVNAAVTGMEAPDAIKQWLAAVDASEPILGADDLAFWDEHGYVVVHDAVPKGTCAAAAQAVFDHVGAWPDDPASWYQRRDHGIMVQYFQHPAFEANRRSPRIHKAFAQLWGTADLWASMDRVGFNVPERLDWPFPGPDLHWDVGLRTPIPFGTQGILYLTDTPPEQGAFTCVPGFQHRIEAWLASLPPGADPRQQNLHALGSQPIGGGAGDLVIWQRALPHGSRPNRGARPRVVQYINMRPARFATRDGWM